MPSHWLVLTALCTSKAESLKLPSPEPALTWSWMPKDPPLRQLHSIPERCPPCFEAAKNWKWCISLHHVYQAWPQIQDRGIGKKIPPPKDSRLKPSLTPHFPEGSSDFSRIQVLINMYKNTWKLHGVHYPHSLMLKANLPGNVFNLDFLNKRIALEINACYHQSLLEVWQHL